MFYEEVQPQRVESNDLAAYDLLAYFYDYFTDPLDTSRVFAYCQPYLQAETKVLDLACGTGNYSILFRQQTDHVLAVDLSSSILACLQAKASQLGPSSDLACLKADISEPDLLGQIASKRPGKWDLITCLTDSCNHLNRDQFAGFIENCYQLLADGGHLVIDLLRLDYLTQDRGDQTFFVELDAEDLTSINTSLAESGPCKALAACDLIWENSWQDETSQATSKLTFFLEQVDQTGCWQKLSETIVEYYYSRSDLDQLITGKLIIKNCYPLAERKVYILTKL